MIYIMHHYRYDLMLSCWEFESQNRPTFLSLQSLLGEQKTKWQSQVLKDF